MEKVGSWPLNNGKNVQNLSLGCFPLKRYTFVLDLPINGAF